VQYFAAAVQWGEKTFAGFMLPEIICTRFGLACPWDAALDWIVGQVLGELQAGMCLWLGLYNKLGLGFSGGCIVGS
jgi:hypothetical protein